MATKPVLDSRIPALVAAALEPLADEMFVALGSHWVGTVELRVAERSEPDDGEDREEGQAVKKAKLRLVALELVHRDSADDERVREFHRGLFKSRTGVGTLDDAEAEAQREASLKVIQ
jgi:hypothetical protein